MLFIVVAIPLANNCGQLSPIVETIRSFAHSKEWVRIAVVGKPEADSSAALRNDKQETSNSKGKTNTEILAALRMTTRRSHDDAVESL
jgi:hypothetical protein